MNQQIIDKFRRNFKAKRIPANSKNVKADYFFELSAQDRLKVCILAGCDYLENVKGVGFSTLMSFFDDTYSEKKQIQQYIEKQSQKLGLPLSYFLPEGVKDVRTYFKMVKLCQLNFRHQLVVDPETY